LESWKLLSFAYVVSPKAYACKSYILSPTPTHLISSHLISSHLISSHLKFHNYSIYKILELATYYTMAKQSEYHKQEKKKKSPTQKKNSLYDEVVSSMVRLVLVLLLMLCPDCLFYIICYNIISI
jgi:hypothetical protein